MTIRIPLNVIDYLSSKVIAHWIMDDGGKIEKGGILINTNSFKEEEVNMLSEALNKKYEIDSRVYSKKKGEKRYPIIYIPKYDYKDKIVPLIYEHFIETMYYKLGVIE